MTRSRSLRRAVLVATAVVTIASSIGASSVSGSSSTLWTSLLRDPGRAAAMAVGEDGSHHILIDDPKASGTTWYATDRTGKWVLELAFGEPADIALDPDGNPWFITFFSTSGMDPGLRLYHMEDGEAVSEDVTAFGALGSTPSNLAGIDVDASGTIHIGWSKFNAGGAYYRSKSAGTWSDTQAIDTTVHGLVGLDVDAHAGIPTMYASGQVTYDLEDRPEGCSPDSAFIACTVAIQLTETPSTAGLGWFEPGQIDLAVDADGDVHGVVRGTLALNYFTNTGGSWSNEPIVSVNASDASIATGPNGPVVFWASGYNAGLRRADRGVSDWTTTTVTTAPAIASIGFVDASNVAHVAIGRIVRHDTEDFSVAYLIAPDFVPPVIGKPRVTPTKGKQIGASTVPSTISWAANDAGSGLAKYQLQRSTSGGSFSTISSTLTAKSTTQTLTSGTNYAYRVRGWDKEGLVSAYSPGPTIKIDRYQDTASAIKFAGTWTRAAFADYSRGSVRYSNSSSATATVTFTGRGFAWVSSYGPNRGVADVFIDGIAFAEVNTYKSSKSYRMVVWSISWEESGLHTVQIKPRGTAGHPRIDVDAVLLVR